MGTALVVELRKKSSNFTGDEKLHFIKTHWNALEGIPSDVINITSLLSGKSPSGHTHDDRYYTETEIDNTVVKLTGNQTITGIKTINTSDLRMNGGSVAYLRPTTTGGWARGFWWQKNATDDVPYERIGGIGVLGNNLSVTKFYIGYGTEPWSGSALEIFPNYTNAKGLKVNNVDVVLNNDTRLTNARPASDVYPWAKESTKPSYNLGEIAETTTYKRVTQSEKDTWNNKISVSTYDGHVPQTGQFLYLTPYGWMGTDRPSDWKEIYAGTSAALSEASTTPITVPSDIYAGKTIAVEIRYGNNSDTSYTNRIVFVTLGTSATTNGSKTYPRYISFSEWDGVYLKNISTKCYVSTTSSTTTIIFGYLKTLIGQFTGTTINWTTEANDNLNVYIGKIWLVG